MAQIPFPKLPCAKLGIVNNKSGTYYYVQTYTHHYDKEKKRSVRDSQKTIGTVIGGSYVQKDPQIRNKGSVNIFQGSALISALEFVTGIRLFMTKDLLLS